MLPLTQGGTVGHVNARSNGCALGLAPNTGQFLCSAFASVHRHSASLRLSNETTIDPLDNLVNNLLPIFSEMVVEDDKLGVARPHRWITLAEQNKRLTEAGCRAVVNLGDKDTRTANLFTFSRPGRMLVLAHAFLLADPSKAHTLGGMAADLDRTLDGIIKAGGAVLDLETGMTTRQSRKEIVKAARVHITRSNRGLSSALNGRRSHGRPKSWTDKADRKIIWNAWHSREYPTNEAAAAAASKALGQEIGWQTMYRVVKRMREEKGDIAAGGASGRLPGNPNFRTRKRSQKRKTKR